MPAATSTNWPDILDPRFQEIFTETLASQLPDMLPTLFRFVTPKSTGQLNKSTFSEAGAFGDFPEFTGTVTYDDLTQGYDRTLTHKQYASGFQIERALFDDDQHEIMNSRPAGLSLSYARTRQKHGAQVFVNSFSIDTTWLSDTESRSLCSDTHTTNAPGVSTATGFDNLSTAALSAVSLSSARLQMLAFRDDRGNRQQMQPSMILVPPDLEETGYEIIKSSGKVNTADNNRNFHEGRYKLVVWNYLSDVNDWWLIDESMMKRYLVWIDRVKLEFAQTEDIDTLIAKWRAYCRYSVGAVGWRWVNGSQVS